MREAGEAAILVRGQEGMPPEAPGPMPSQPLDHFDPALRRVPLRPWETPTARARRFLVLGASAVLAALAINEMRLALSVDHLTPVSVLALLLFAVNITWISLPFVTSFVGLLRSARRRRPDPADDRPLGGRTALLMPIYNEDPARVAAALEAMAREIAVRGEARSFDLFLLSDSTDGDMALSEQEAVWALRRRLGGMRVYYRRRAQNIAHKAGNIRDFCERWGRSYDHLLMLDADSLMDGETIIRLARRMERDPDAGLIQTLPRLHRGVTLLARIQQFAGRLYGSLLGQGMAWWAGGEASYWGHNAIVRTRAFMECAGLPALPGQPPFGGTIMSHDFVEAALIRRGGWSVSIAPDLEGSYEECPSSIIDLAIRDRRWCQGNLQHARILPARGLHWVSRLHLVAGMMSYLSSPFWLLFVLSTLALGVQYEFARHQYFLHVPTLFPLWPRIDPARAIRLFALTMAVLFGPKLMGLLSILVSRHRRRESGGLVRLLAGFTLEVATSALIAPVLALIHCGLVADILRGRDSGWRAQRREVDTLPWPQVLSRHRWHMVDGVVLAGVSWFVSWQMLAWLTPAVVGMVLAPTLSKLTGSAELGRHLQRLGLLRTKDEAQPPAVALAADAALPFYRQALARVPDLAEVISDPRRLERHLALTDREPAHPGGQVDAVEAVAEKKIRTARNLEEAVASLTARERARVQALPSLLGLLARTHAPGMPRPATVAHEAQLPPPLQ
ncbi:MAG TPA: glucans biosynthesis glucosyltransferase MdoH [Anaeromyxobacter sp.]|nr:glucans biosynthesis glucosyltransferase MdoH [Anaeromyxobacter sp.]